MKPLLSIITPTLNAETVLPPYFKAIHAQHFPKERIEILCPDGGSTDNTREILRKEGVIILENSLKTAEAGKTVGLKAAQGEYVLLLDSDNILPHPDWLNRLLKPLGDNPKIVGSEPWAFTYRREADFIERYCALIGANDPIVHFYGTYDKINVLTGKWTDIPLQTIDHGDWLEVTLSNQKPIPTIGANGTLFRREFLQQYAKGEYLFDIDILHQALSEREEVRFAKVKESIIHTYCEASIPKFARKQRRRIHDYLFHKQRDNRAVNWNVGGSNNRAIIRFVFYTCSGIFPLLDALKGYYRKPDPAWFFHPLACMITLWEYGTGILRNVRGSRELSRTHWGQ